MCDVSTVCGVCGCSLRSGGGRIAHRYYQYFSIIVIVYSQANRWLDVEVIYMFIHISIWIRVYMYIIYMFIYIYIWIRVYVYILYIQIYVYIENEFNFYCFVGEPSTRR